MAACEIFFTLGGGIPPMAAFVLSEPPMDDYINLYSGNHKEYGVLMVNPSSMAAYMRF